MVREAQDWPNLRLLNSWATIWCETCRELFGRCMKWEQQKEEGLFCSVFFFFLIEICRIILHALQIRMSAACPSAAQTYQSGISEQHFPPDLCEIFIASLMPGWWLWRDAHGWPSLWASWCRDSWPLCGPCRLSEVPHRRGAPAECLGCDGVTAATPPLTQPLSRCICSLT